MAHLGNTRGGLRQLKATALSYRLSSQTYRLFSSSIQAFTSASSVICVLPPEESNRTSIDGPWAALALAASMSSMTVPGHPACVMAHSYRLARRTSRISSWESAW